MWVKASILEEAKVLEFEDVGAALFLLGNFYVFLRTHGKEKARVVICKTAVCRMVKFSFCNSVMMLTGLACCCFSIGSSCLNAWYW